MFAMVAMVANAHDFEVGGIYYNITSHTDLTVAVTYEGTYYSYSNEYTGIISIPTSVAYDGETYAVTSIGNRAFCECTGLTRVTIPISVTSIDYDAFAYCTGLLSVTIPNSVTSIGSSAFAGCTGLTSVDIPDGVKTIGNSAFSGCTGLTSITIPNSVTSIESYVFSGCTGLTSVTIEDGTTELEFGGSVFKDAPLQSLYVGRDFTCSALSVSNYPFNGQTTLTSLTIADNVTSIGYAAFRRCSGLTSVIIPNSVTSIGYYAFYECTGLTSMDLPNSVTSIGDYAFYKCTGLTSVTSLATTPPTCGTDVFYNVDTESCTLHVPTGTKSLYQAADQWKDFYNISDGTETGISSAATCSSATEASRYNLSGQRIQNSQRGLKIIRMSDGSTRKVLVK